MVDINSECFESFNKKRLVRMRARIDELDAQYPVCIWIGASNIYSGNDRSILLKPEIQAWVDQMCTGYVESHATWEDSFYSESKPFKKRFRAIWFENKEDAMLFKLTWL